MAEGIVNIIKEWLFGPAEPKECPNCEILKEQLAFANYDRKMLLEHFVRATMPTKEEQKVVFETPAPIRQSNKPWKVRQQELERQSRERARMQVTRREDAPRTVTPESIEKLEQELGVGDGISGEAVQENR